MNGTFFTATASRAGSGKTTAAHFAKKMSLKVENYLMSDFYNGRLFRFVEQSFFTFNRADIFVLASAPICCALSPTKISTETSAQNSMEGWSMTEHIVAHVTPGTSGGI